jgi:hypothetical protein
MHTNPISSHDRDLEMFFACCFFRNRKLGIGFPNAKQRGSHIERISVNEARGEEVKLIFSALQRRKFICLTIGKANATCG